MRYSVAMRSTTAGKLAAGLLLAAALGVAGCSSPAQSREFEIAEGGYPAAFDAARESLRDLRFHLDRVDAASGVITTSPKPTSGLATPWDSEQSGIDQEWEDFINRQRRTVRVTFRPKDTPEEPQPSRDPGAAKSVAGVDLRDAQCPVIGTVEVTVERVQRPGWQVNTKSVNNSTFTRDPELSAKGMFPTYAVELEPDERLAKRIAASIQKKMSEAK